MTEHRKSLGKMTNAELEAEYEQESGAPFQRSPIEPMPGAVKAYRRVLAAIAIVSVLLILAGFALRIAELL